MFIQPLSGTDLAIFLCKWVLLWPISGRVNRSQVYLWYDSLHCNKVLLVRVAVHACFCCAGTVNQVQNTEKSLGILFWRFCLLWSGNDVEGQV